MIGQVIKKRAGVYQVRIPLGRDQHGTRKYKTLTIHGTKKQAEAERARLAADQSQGTLVIDSDMTLAEFITTWLDDVVALKVRPRTLEDYRGMLGRYILPALGAKSLSALTPMVVQAEVSALSQRALSPRTVRYAFSLLRNALNHAVVIGMLRYNPSIRITMPKGQQREMKALTAEQVQQFLAEARGTRYEALWWLLFSTGLRPSEALGLKWSDITSNKASIQRKLTRLKNGWSFDAPKTAKGRRVVRLFPKVLDALATHRARQNQARLLAGERWVEHDLIFCTESGQPLDWRVIARRYFRPLAKKCGLGNVRPYDMRHTCASLLLGNGVPVSVVSELLGHSSATMTLDVYSHVLPSMQDHAADQMERLLLAGVPDGSD